MSLYIYPKIQKEKKPEIQCLWLIPVAVFFIFVFYPFQKGNEGVAGETAKSVLEDPYANLDILAQSVYVFDVKENKALFARNENFELPLASLTKVMTAITALSIIPDGTLIPITKEFLEQEGDSGLYAGEKWPLQKLLRLTLVESSNDGAYAVASAAGAFDAGTENLENGRQNFIEKMNEKAVELSLTETRFFNPTGLDESASISGGYGSARDITKLFAYAVKTYPEIFTATREKELELQSADELNHHVLNTNANVDNIPNLIASKTGYTDLSGGNLVIAFNADFNRPIVIAVLGSTQEGRFEDVEKLVWATLKKLQSFPNFKASKLLYNRHISTL